MKIAPTLKKEVAAYVESAKEHLSAGKILFENNLYRDSVSRLYYAVYDTVCALLLTKGLAPKTHSGAIRLFALHFVKTGVISVKYSDLFTSIFVSREEADYTRRTTINKERTDEILKAASDFIKMAEKLLPKLLK